MLTQIPRRAFLKEGALETCLLLLSLSLCPAEKQENILLSNLSRLQQGRRRSACLSPVRPGSRNDRNEIVCGFSHWAWGAQGTGRLVSHTAFSPQGLGSVHLCPLASGSARKKRRGPCAHQVDLLAAKPPGTCQGPFALQTPMPWVLGCLPVVAPGASSPAGTPGQTQARRLPHTAAPRDGSLSAVCSRAGHLCASCENFGGDETKDHRDQAVCPRSRLRGGRKGCPSQRPRF